MGRTSPILEEPEISCKSKSRKKTHLGDLAVPPANVATHPAPVAALTKKRTHPTSSTPNVVNIDDNDEDEEAGEGDLRASRKRRTNPPLSSDAAPAGVENVTSSPIGGRVSNDQPARDGLPVSPSALDEPEGMGFMPNITDPEADHQEDRENSEESADPSVGPVFVNPEELFNVRRLDDGFLLPNGHMVQPGYRANMNDHVPVSLMGGNLVKAECSRFLQMSPDACVKRQAFYFHKV